jgi:hypothetical protein
MIVTVIFSGVTEVQCAESCVSVAQALPSESDSAVRVQELRVQR